MDEEWAIKVLDALAQSTRLRAFRLVAGAGDDGLGNAEIAAALGLSRSTLSRHLGSLVEAGLLTGERTGRNVRYLAVARRVEDALGYVTGDTGAADAAGR